MLAPSSGVDIQAGDPAHSNTLRLLRIKTDVFKSYKQLVLQRSGDRRFTLPLPTLMLRRLDTHRAAGLQNRSRRNAHADRLHPKSAGRASHGDHEPAEAVT